jgi:uncharacterized protein YndB with AHSA1/START domain
MNEEIIQVSTRINASVKKVWRHYTSPESIVKWNAASDDWHTTTATVDLREGGRFCSRMEAKDGSMGFDFEGTYTKVEPHSCLEYTFGDRNARVDFDSSQVDVVVVTVTFDAEESHTTEQQRLGWQSILDNFRKHVESDISKE